MSRHNLGGAAAAAQPALSEEFFTNTLKPLFAGNSKATDLPHVILVDKSINDDFPLLSFDQLKELHEIFSQGLANVEKPADVARINAALVTHMAAIAVAAATKNDRDKIAGSPYEPGKLVLKKTSNPNKPPYNFEFKDLDASILMEYAEDVNQEDGAANVKVTKKEISFANIGAMRNFYTCADIPKTGETSLASSVASSAAPTPSVSKAASSVKVVGPAPTGPWMQ